MREKCRQAGQTVAWPGLGPRAHERQGHGGGDALRRPVLHGAVEVDRADAEIAAAGREQFAGKLVIGFVRREGCQNPAMIRLGGVGPEIDGKLRLDPQEVAPFHRPIGGKFFPLQQPVNQRGALVRGLIQDELPRFHRRGQRADYIQVDAPDEHGIRADRRRLKPELLQLAENQLVNPALRDWVGQAFKGVLFGTRGGGSAENRCEAEHRNQQYFHLVNESAPAADDTNQG